MKRPPLNLPPLSVPWGRWVEENIDLTSAAISRETLDVNSAGSVFAGQADLLQGQIATIPSVSAIYERSLPPSSVTRALNPSATGYVYTLPEQTFSPPRPDQPYDFTVIANVVATGTLMTFARSLIRTNDIDNTYQHENLRPGMENTGTFSIIGTGSIGIGGIVRAEAGVIASASGTVTFTSASMWCVFSGSIL